MKSEWQITLSKIFNAETDSLIELARIAGSNPKDFYKNADLRGVRVKKAELESLPLETMDMEGAIISDVFESEEELIDCMQLFEELGSSASFAQTHSIVARILTYESYTLEMAKKFMTSVQNNNQVSWIVEDQDLRELIAAIRNSPEVKFSKSTLNDLKSITEKLLH